MVGRKGREHGYREDCLPGMETLEMVLQSSDGKEGAHRSVGRDFSYIEFTNQIGG